MLKTSIAKDLLVSLVISFRLREWQDSGKRVYTIGDVPAQQHSVIMEREINGIRKALYDALWRIESRGERESQLN